VARRVVAEAASKMAAFTKGKNADGTTVRTLAEVTGKLSNTATAKCRSRSLE
jgi:hypothetical protein